MGTNVERYNQESEGNRQCVDEKLIEFVILVNVHKYKNENDLPLRNEENVFFSKEVSVITDFKKSTVAFNDACSNNMLEPVQDVF